MPYVITTRTPYAANEVPPHMRAIPNALGPRVTRRAVATLDEARGDAVEIILNVWDVHGEEGVLGPYEDFLDDARAIGSACEGCFTKATVGPLPDGTVIEVEQVEWSALIAPAGGVARNRRDLIDAY